MRKMKIVVPLIATLLHGNASLGAQSLMPIPAEQTHWTVSLAGGTVAEHPLGISSQVSAHALVGLSFARRGWPVELRGDLAVRSSASSAGYAALNASAILPLARIAIRQTTLRPYALAGMGMGGFAMNVPGVVQSFGSHAGAGVRLERARTMLLSELRYHTMYRRSFLSFGAAWRL
jgi:hypothetical protein